MLPATAPDSVLVTDGRAWVAYAVCYAVVVLAYPAGIVIVARNQLVFARNGFRYHVEGASGRDRSSRLVLWRGEGVAGAAAGGALLFAWAVSVAVVTSLPSPEPSAPRGHFLLAAGAMALAGLAGFALWSEARDERRATPMDAVVVAVGTSVVTVVVASGAVVLVVLAVLGGVGATRLDLLHTIAWAHVGLAVVAVLVLVVVLAVVVLPKTREAPTPTPESATAPARRRPRDDGAFRFEGTPRGSLLKAALCAGCALASLYLFLAPPVGMAPEGRLLLFFVAVMSLLGMIVWIVEAVIRSG